MPNKTEYGGGDDRLGLLNSLERSSLVSFVSVDRVERIDSTDRDMDPGMMVSVHGCQVEETRDEG